MADWINELRLLRLQLSRLEDPLKALSRMHIEDEERDMIERLVTEQVHDIEDTIDTCIIQNIAGRRGSRFGTIAEYVNQMRKDKEPVLSKLEQLILDLAPAPYTVVNETTENRPQKRPHNIVGLEDEADTVIAFLNTESTNLEIITIVGMPGLGKTTLAWKIIMDDRIQYEFPVVIWVNISDHLNMKNVLITILHKFTSNVPDVPIDELVTMAKSYLESGKFLIVMDDVWTVSDWCAIKDILPLKNKLSRILITSRNKEVATHANPMRGPHNLRFLTEDESWELLQYEVYGIADSPQELKKAGFAIANNCDQLPLSIVVIGGILRDELPYANFTAVLRKKWKEISKSVITYLYSKDETKLLEKTISLSYKKLPYELRNCFLYLGMFPKDTDIPVKKMVRLWIAEGFIQETNGNSLEETAHDNVKFFISLGLLMVKAEKPDGEPKLCRVHGAVREYCKKEAASRNLNLFQEIYKSDRGVFQPSHETREKCRRLCIRSYVLDFFKEQPLLPKVRSFLCYEYNIHLDVNNMSLVTDGFPLLRVYDAGTIKFPKLPPKIFQLVHLRYLNLAIASECKILPAVISKLWNLQTLILDIPSHTLEIGAGLWMLRQLRHVKTKASIILKNLDGKGEGWKNLQTLGRISHESYNEKVFAKAKNLITLGIQGEFSSQFVESRSFEKLLLLNKLTLVHQGAADNPMPCLPEQHRFPPNLKNLVLIGTLLDWHKLFVLERLSHLEELKLKENACKGDTWEVDRGFNRLKLLQIEMVPELKCWKVNGDAFPELRVLLIRNCKRLVEVPIVLGKKLELLRMERVTPEAVSCAEEIGKEKKAGANERVFKLDIAPADRPNSYFHR